MATPRRRMTAFRILSDAATWAEFSKPSFELYRALREILRALGLWLCRDALARGDVACLHLRHTVSWLEI